MKLLLLAALASADLFLVRHAEKLEPKKDASLLSPRGHERAKTLARVLADVPLKAVYCTEYERTLQTALPTAKKKGLEPIRTDSEDVKGLAEALRARASDEHVLVVGHSDTLPELLSLLGAAGPEKIEAEEYDNLFIVRLSSGRASTHRLRYGR